jgi:hypothetical protein
MYETNWSEQRHSKAQMAFIEHTVLAVWTRAFHWTLCEQLDPFPMLMLFCQLCFPKKNIDIRSLGSPCKCPHFNF